MKKGKCKDCYPGYKLNPETCACDELPVAQALCKPGDAINAQCKCGLAAAYDAKCFYHYSLDTSDCSCHKPEPCNLTRRDCGKGVKFDRANCQCVEKSEECTPCNAGEKQNPFTCDCINYTVKPMLCPAGGVLNSATCECSWTNMDGVSKTLAARCQNGYEAGNSCTTCNLKAEH